MRSLIAQLGAASGIALVILFLCSAEIASALDTNFFPDPGWTYAYDGDQAFFGTGLNGEPSLVDPAGNDGKTEWVPRSSQWDGSAPGDPLGGSIGVPDDASFEEQLAKLASNPPAAPGGVQTYTDFGTSYLRMQDPGSPDGLYGWADRGTENGPPVTNVAQGSHRQVNFGHDISADEPFSGNSNVIDLGITISFRSRIATRAQNPALDDEFPENGANTADTIPWPTAGLGYAIANEGRGMFNIGQNRGAVESQISFGFVNQNTLDFDGQNPLPFTKTGLVMNNRFIGTAGGDVDSNAVGLSDANVNIVEIPNAELNDWQEFWITVEAINLVGGVPQANFDNNTHEVNVYWDGAADPMVPETFEVVLGPESQFAQIDIPTFIAMGLSSQTRRGAFDTDFFAYKEGVLDPFAVSVNADFDGDGDVDGADFMIWQRGFGNGTTPGEGDANGDMVVNDADLTIWKSQFGTMPPPLSGLAVVPEPTTIGLLLVGGLALACLGARKKTITR